MSFKQFCFVFSFIFISLNLTAQQDWPQPITPELLKKIKAEVEKEVPAFRAQLLKMEMTGDQVEFAIDTFRIERIVDKRMDIDYSTQGMNQTVNEMRESYDKLMNKYYNKLLKALKPADQKTLIAAQRAWIAYRDAEVKLIGTMTKEEYSGGGTIQTNIFTGSYADIVVRRALEIFNYYDEMMKE